MQITTNLDFDEKGNLIPYGRSIVSIKYFYTFFVQNFKESETRKEIFRKYLNYTLELYSQLDMDIFFQYVGGSFVTNKENPKDIDIVNFIRISDLKKLEECKKEEFMTQFFTHFDPITKEKIKGKNIEKYNVDSYLVPLYSEEDSAHKEEMQKTIYTWQHWLSKDKSGNDKGFLKIIIDKEILETLKNKLC